MEVGTQRQITWSDRFFATASWLVSNLQERATSSLFGYQQSQSLSTAEHFDRVVKYSLAALHATHQAINPPTGPSDFTGDGLINHYLEQRQGYLRNVQHHWGEVWTRAKNGFDVEFAAKALIAAGTIAVAPRALILSTALTIGFFRFTTSTKQMIFEKVDAQNKNTGSLPLYAGALYSALLLSWKVAEGTPSSLLSIPLSIATGLALGFSISRPDHLREEGKGFASSDPLYPEHDGNHSGELSELHPTKSPYPQSGQQAGRRNHVWQQDRQDR